MGFYGTLKLIFIKMKRKLDHGPDGRPFPTGKKRCKGNSCPSSLAPFQATATTFGELRLANGHSAQRRRVTSGPPPSGLQDWLHIFQAWSGPERLLAMDELIDRCETNQVKHMMQLIEPQFQRDFISLLPKELSLYVLSFLAPGDLLQAAQTCSYWRTLAEDNLLWREKCREEAAVETGREVFRCLAYPTMREWCGALYEGLLAIFSAVSADNALSGDSARRRSYNLQV
ncbi:unnamed protein product [Boreogadus saida]